MMKSPSDIKRIRDEESDLFRKIKKGSKPAKVALFTRQQNQIEFLARKYAGNDELLWEEMVTRAFDPIDENDSTAWAPLEKALKTYDNTKDRHQTFGMWCRGYLVEYFKSVKRSHSHIYGTLTDNSREYQSGSRKDGLPLYDEYSDEIEDLFNRIPTFLDPQTNEMVALLASGRTHAETMAMIGVTHAEFHNKLDLIKRCLGFEGRKQAASFHQDTFDEWQSRLAGGITSDTAESA